MTKESHTGGKIAIGALLAGAAGYVAGVLTAPKSGKETRRDLAVKAGEIKEESIDKLKSAQDELAELIDSAKGKSLALNAKAREKYNEALVAAKDAKSKAATVLKAVKDGQSSEPELDKALSDVKAAYKNLATYIKS